MIFIIVGDLGAGKSIFLTWLCNIFALDGYTVYANFILKHIKHKEITSIRDWLKLKTAQNFFALDEGSQDMDSRRSLTIGNIIQTRNIMQSRKIGGDKYAYPNHVAICEQTWKLCDPRVRGIANVIFMPSVLLEDEYGKPLILDVKFFINDSQKKIMSLDPIILVPPYCNIDIAESYETKQIIEKLDDGLLDDIEYLLNKYKDNKEALKYKTPTKMQSYIYYQELKAKNNPRPADVKIVCNIIDGLRPEND